MRALTLMIIFPAVLSFAECSKGSSKGPCTGIANADPSFCLDVPATDYKPEEPRKYEKGGSMSIRGATPDKGWFTLGWYAASEDAYRTYNASKQRAKIDASGETSGGKGEWYAERGGKMVYSVVQLGKWTFTCVATNTTKPGEEACKTFH